MNTRESLRRLLTLAFLAMLLVGMAAAADYYIRTDGNDSNTGTADTAGAAWQTIGKIRFATLNPGDVVHVNSGTYDESSVYGIFVGGYTIRGATPNRPVLRRISLDIQDLADGLRLENLDFDDAQTHINVIQTRQGLQNLALVGCDLKNPLNQVDPDGNRAHGCLVNESLDGLLLDTCRFVYSPAAPLAGLSYNVAIHNQFPASNNWTVRNCTFIQQPSVPSGAGGNIVLWSGLANFTVENNTFAWANREHISISNQSGVTQVHNLANWTIRNNRFLGTGNTASIGIGYPHSVVNWRIENNFFTQSADQAIYFWGGGAPGMVPTLLDGFVVTGNTFEDEGKGTSAFTDGGIIMNNVLLAPTAGRQNSITNNVFRDTRGGAHGGWGIFVRGNGPAPTITDNSFDHTREACVLVGGCPYNSVGNRTLGLTDPLVVGNTVNGNTYGGVVVRYENSADGPGIVQNAVVDNNTIQSCNQYGVSVETSNDVNTSIRYNDITQCGAGIQIAGQATLRNNEVFSCLNSLRAGIWLTPFGTNPSVVSNSVVAFNLTTACAGYGIRVDSTLGVGGQNLRVYNNTIVGNQPSGMLIGLSNMAIYNNIVAFHTGTGMVFSATEVGTMGYNLHYNVFSGGTNFSGFPGSTNFPGDIVGQDPLLVDFFNLDFHLLPNSPAILAAGLLLGNSLIAGGGDMGAYPTGVVSAEVEPSAWELYR